MKKKTNIIISLKPTEKKLLVWKKLVMQEKSNGANTNASTLAKAALEYYITHGNFLQIGSIPRKVLNETDVSDIKRTLSVYAPDGSTLRSYIDKMLQKKVNFKTSLLKGYLAASIIITDDDMDVHIPSYDEIFPFIIDDEVSTEIQVVRPTPHSIHIVDNKPAINSALKPTETRPSGTLMDISPKSNSSPEPKQNTDIIDDIHAELISSKSYEEEGLSVRDASNTESDTPIDEDLINNFMGLINNK